MEQATLLTPTEATDEYGNAVFDWSDPDEVTVHGLLEPVVAVEGEGQVVSGRARLYIPHTYTTVARTARVEVRGGTWELVSDPAVWRGFGGIGGTVLELVRVVGVEEGDGS